MPLLAEPGLVVVHLLTHGEQGRGQTVLYVLGPDGARVQPSVGEWLNRAEERGGDCGPVLFVLDVCHAGAAVEYQLQQLVDAERQRAWVLAASSGADPAYDGRLTRALTQVLDGFRSGKLQVDPSVRYIPLRRLFNEVDRLVREQSRGSYPQQIHSSYVPLHVDVDQLEFFPNPALGPALQERRPRLRWTPSLAALLDEAFDPRHFMRRAGAAEAVFGQVGRGFFHGRGGAAAATAGLGAGGRGAAAGGDRQTRCRQVGAAGGGGLRGPPRAAGPHPGPVGPAAAYAAAAAGGLPGRGARPAAHSRADHRVDRPAVAAAGPGRVR